ELDRPGVLARLQHHRVAAELERAQLEAGTGAQRGIEEHQRDRLALERVASGAALELGGPRQHRVEPGAGPVLGIEEVLHRVGLALPRRRCRAWSVVPAPGTKKPGTGPGFVQELQ